MSAEEKPVIDARPLALIDDLRALPAETSWVEFKENNADPQMIGRLISALSNAARLADQHFAYVLWGVQDGDHVVTGTSFEPSSQTPQNQPLELWLAQRLQPGGRVLLRSRMGQGAVTDDQDIDSQTQLTQQSDRTATSQRFVIRMGSHHQHRAAN